MATDPSQLIVQCGTCAFWRRAQDNEQLGTCMRYPPTPVALPQPQVDVMKGERGMGMSPVGIRPSMQASEFCGEWRPRQKMSSEAAAKVVQ